MEIQRRMTAALLALTMVFTMLPIGVRAEENEEDGACIVPETVQTEPAETVEADALIIPEAAETEALETLPETTIPEETWEIGDIVVEETKETVAAGEIVANGTCGENATWMLDGEGLLTIFGSGEITGKWSNVKKQIKCVLIEDGIKSIGNSAFSGCTNLEEVIFPESVISIGAYAFSNCTGLKEISLPKGIAAIENGLFSQCNLTQITIPEGVTSIGLGAFSGNELTEIVLPDSVAAIGTEAFRDCTQLAEINIPENVITIGDSAFAGCDALIDIVIPNSVTSLGKKVFYQCDHLTTVILGDSVMSIPESAFYRCEKLVSINMPKSITSIGKDAFSQCTSLSDVNVGEGVTSIGKEAFYRCSSLDKVVIPDSVTSIAERAFYICEGITSITVGNGVTSIEKQTFSDNTNLKEVKFGNNISKIGESAFSGCKSLTEITLPNTVESIGKSAFLGCKALTAADIGGEKTAIMESAFSGCSSLTSVTIREGVTYIGEAAFSGCTSLGSFTIPNSMTSIGKSVFSGCTGLDSITIPDNVTSIGKRAFQDCTGLISVDLGKGLVSIDGWAFSGCSSLNSLVIPDSVTSIAGVAFEKCAGLVSVTIGAGLSSLSTRTFENCNNLESFTVDENNSHFASENGMLCSKDMKKLILCPAANAYSYTIPEGVTTIDEYAFRDCVNMTAVFIPASVTTINNYAFSDSLGMGSTNLENVYFGGTAEEWEQVKIGEYGNAGLVSADVIPNAEGIPDDSTNPGEEPEWSVVHESFLKPIKQIMDPDDIPYGYKGIYSKEDLMAINNNRSGKYILMADIELDSWYSLCYYSDPFTGVLEGNGHTISGLDESEYSTPSMYWGLFAAIDGAKISNLRLTGTFDVKLGDWGSTDCCYYLGGLAGEAKGDIKITNCVNDVTFNCTAEYSDYIQAYLGGLIGRYTGSGAQITDCRNTADITSVENTGGLVGYMELGSGKVTISNCHNDGAITCVKDVSPDDISGLGGPFGGIVGYISGKGASVIISGCINRGDITAGRKNSGGLVSGNNAGGIVGSAYCQTTIASCANTGNVSAILRAGGIAANLSAQSVVQDCLNTGTIDSNNALYNAGGIAADGGTFLRCLNTGPVKTPPVQGKSYNSAIAGNPSGNTEAEAEAAIVDCYWLDDGQTNTLYSLYSNDFGESKAIRTRGMLSLEALTEEENFQNFSFPDVWVMDYKRKHPFPAAVHVISIEEYLDNSEIRINGSGSAFAYYQGDPNTIYHYTLNGEKDTVTSDDKGIIRIMLGTYLSDTTNEHTVTFTQVGNKVLSPSIGFKSTVIAEKLAYTYEAQSSFDVSVGKLAEKFGISVSGGVGLGVGTTIRKDYENGICTMEMYDKAAVDLYGKFELDTPGEFAVANIKFANISAQLKATGMGIYGHRFQNYKKDSPENMKAFATFLLGETLQEKPNFVFLQEFQQWLANKLYSQTSVDKIRGSGASISGGWGFELGNFEINDVQLISGLKQEVEYSAAIAEKSYSSGGNEYSTAFSTSADLDLASVSVFGGTLGADFLSRDNSVNVRKENGEKTLEGVTIGSGGIGVASIKKGGRCTTNYKHYVFEEDTLKELMGKSETIASYVNGDRIAMSNKDIEMLAETISDSKVPIEYTESKKTNRLGTIDLEFGLPLIGWEFGAELCTMESVEYQTAGGFAVKDEILITSESGDYSAVVENELKSLSDAIDDAIASLIEDVNAFFTKVGDTVQKGAETIWGWIDGAAGSISDWFVSLTCASSEDVWGISYEIGVKSDQVNFALAKLVNNSSEAYATRTARTIGRPFIVNVTDGTTGEQIKDFGTAPLTFTIRYAGEDLLAANYDAGTQVISMYRYSDDGDYFEYIGGIHDAEAKTVTAAITKPGQYILAAEEIPEEEPGEDAHEFKLGDVNHDSKINAKDATLILQSSVGVLKDSAKFCEECAEVSGDGKLNAKDSTLILQFSVGLRESFPGQK